MHILLIRFSSMGDVVLQTATINWLRSLFGDEIRLTFVTSQEFVSLLDKHPEVDGVIGFNRRGGDQWKDLVKKVRALHKEDPIDLIFDLHATLRSFRLKLSFWHIPALTVDKRRWERFLLTKIPFTGLKKLFSLETQVERIIKDFEWTFDDGRGVSRTKDFRHGPHREMTSLEELPEYPLPKPYLVLAPSASFAPKRWPIENFVGLAKRLISKTNYHVVVLAGPTDSFCAQFDEIQSERLHNLQGKTSLKESMNVLAHTKLCIGNDSGMNHITEAHGISCLTLFGPTDPRFGFAPHGQNSKFISKELYCKPCSTTGKKECTRDKLYCMEMITVDEVEAMTLKMLENL